MDTIHKNAEAAAAQIRDRNYPKAIENFGGELLLVGISCQKGASAGRWKHVCIIEEYRVRRKQET